MLKPTTRRRLLVGRLNRKSFAKNDVVRLALAKDVRDKRSRGAIVHPSRGHFPQWTYTLNPLEV